MTECLAIVLPAGLCLIHYLYFRGRLSIWLLFVIIWLFVAVAGSAIPWLIPTEPSEEMMNGIYEDILSNPESDEDLKEHIRSDRDEITRLATIARYLPLIVLSFIWVALNTVAYFIALLCLRRNKNDTEAFLS